MKFQHFSDDELREIASLIAGRNLVTSRRDDILGDIYDQIIIELRTRRTLLDDNQQKLN